MIPKILVTINPSNFIQSHLSIDIANPHSDVVIFTAEKSLGVEIIAQSRAYLHTKPFSKPYKYLIFPQSETLTLVAQNALLKSLEESPEYIQFILCTPQVDKLLGTIISRSLVVYDHSRSQSNLQTISEDFFQTLTSGSISQKIALAETYSHTRSEALELILSLTLYYRSQLHHHNSSAYAPLLRTLQLCHQALQANTNPQLVLEHLFLSHDWIS